MANTYSRSFAHQYHAGFLPLTLPEYPPHILFSLLSLLHPSTTETKMANLI